MGDGDRERGPGAPRHPDHARRPGHARGEDREPGTFSFIDERGAGAEDRRLWLRRLPERHVELVAEPSWSERHRLVAQVLALNDDLIASQRSVARRQRDLERAQGEAARAADRVSQLEAILCRRSAGRPAPGLTRGQAGGCASDRAAARIRSAITRPGSPAISSATTSAPVIRLSARLATG